MNKTSSKEWLIKAWHNLSSASLLYNAKHYTDVIAVELHYSVEKVLKSFLAYENKKIPKTHDLNEIHETILDKISFTNEELDLLDIITEYHIDESYPVYDRKMPSREELQEVLYFTEAVFQKVCNILDIKLEEVQV